MPTPQDPQGYTSLYGMAELGCLGAGIGTLFSSPGHPQLLVSSGLFLVGAWCFRNVRRGHVRPYVTAPARRRPRRPHHGAVSPRVPTRAREGGLVTNPGFAVAFVLGGVVGFLLCFVGGWAA